ncbi:hypothetical protein V1477_009749 [Vespula maculifrons]|uniref:Uncharacterized protein n=1 Tax=Vespula maculifrons TaxID=7453 RepID=A0ABD2CBE1_VESMC
MSKSINEQHNCEVGILGCERRQQSGVFARLWQLLVQLCFGLRRVDLEIFADVIRASINKEIMHVYFLSLVFSTFDTISFVLDFDEALLEDVDGLSPRGPIGNFIGHHKNEN